MTTNGETGLRWLDRPEPNIPKARQLMQRVLDDARRAVDIVARIRAMAAGRTPQVRISARRRHDGDVVHLSRYDFLFVPMKSIRDYWDKTEKLYEKLNAATINIVLHH